MSFAIIAVAATVGVGAYGASQSGRAGAAAERAERLRQLRIKQGMGEVDSAFSGYTPEVYNQRAQAYQNYALPQLNEQYNKSQGNTLFGLANRGLTKSSIADKEWSDFNKEAGRARQTVVDQGLQEANNLRLGIENSRQNIIGQLNQTSDPGQAKQAAIASASNFQAPPAFGALNQMFSNLGSQYLTNQILTGQVNRPLANSMGNQNYGLPSLSLPVTYKNRV